MSIELGTKEKMMAWVSKHNLNRVICFHNYVMGLLKEQLVELEQADQAILENKLHRDALHEFEHSLHINTFLMIYAYFEEYSFLFERIYAPGDETEGKGLRRFKHVKTTLLTNGHTELWNDLMVAEQVRNCLLHANGRIDLLKTTGDAEQMRKLVKRRKLKARFQRVEVTNDYLADFHRYVASATEIIISCIPEADSPKLVE